MYGKIFAEIFDSTLADYGADTIYVFIAMIVKSDALGELHLTASALARTVRMDIKTVQKAIENLEQPDPNSNDPSFEGRRIIPMEIYTEGKQNRGWWIVNKDNYRKKGNPENRKIQNREAQQRFRDKNKNNTPNNPKSNSKHSQQSNCLRSLTSKQTSAHTDTDTDTNINLNPFVPLGNLKKILLPKWINQKAWTDFIQHCETKRKPLTEIVVQKNLEILFLYQDRQQEIVDNMIRGRWSGLVKPRSKTNESQNVRVNRELAGIKKRLHDP